MMSRGGLFFLNMSLEGAFGKQGGTKGHEKLARSSREHVQRRGPANPFATLPGFEPGQTTSKDVMLPITSQGIVKLYS